MLSFHHFESFILKNDAQVNWACITERKKNSVPCGILSRNQWIYGPENNHCANKATDVAIGETHR